MYHNCLIQSVMTENFQIDRIKLNRWLNIRKTTIKHLNKDLRNKLNFNLTLDNCHNLDSYSINLISKYLEVSNSKLVKEILTATFLISKKEAIIKTKRSIFKNGIHFYNYYTLPTPKGYISPVLLDILCPKNKLPKLNNGHLEPAISLNLGPNDIYARFGKKFNKDTWVKFKINKDPKTNWVVGSSYFEPSFCRHTYSRATNGPARVISYTTRSNLEDLLSKKLNENSYNNLMNYNKNKRINRSLLKLEINSKGYSLKEISKKTKCSYNRILNYFNNKKNQLDKKELKKICKFINLDHNLFLDIKHKEDSVGKSYFDYKKSLKTIRKFKSYNIASIASSKRFPDLSGYFMKVLNNTTKSITDLFDSKCCHYLVTGGNFKTHIKEKNKKIIKNISEGDCLWMSAFTYHGFTGEGSLLKISDGQNIDYLEKLDLTNTYNINLVLKRSRNDIENWGYDPN